MSRNITELRQRLLLGALDNGAELSAKECEMLCEQIPADRDGMVFQWFAHTVAITLKICGEPRGSAIDESEAIYQSLFGPIKGNRASIQNLTAAEHRQLLEKVCRWSLERLGAKEGRPL